MRCDGFGGWFVARLWGVIVIDTPGIRELGVWGDDGLETTFSDVTRLLGQCRYRNCSHDTEPGCAIQAAIDADELDAAVAATGRDQGTTSGYG